jgi:hypothetical protein
VVSVTHPYGFILDFLNRIVYDRMINQYGSVGGM